MQLLIVITLFSSLFSGILNVPDSYTTIQEAVNASSSNDTILINNGYYEEEVVISRKNLTLASYYIFSQDNKYITNTTISSYHSPLSINQDSFVKIIGLSFSSNVNGLDITDSEVHLKNIIIFNAYDEGFALDLSNSNINILKSTFFGFSNTINSNNSEFNIDSSILWPFNEIIIDDNQYNSSIKYSCIKNGNYNTVDLSNNFYTYPFYQQSIRDLVHNSIVSSLPDNSTKYRFTQYPWRGFPHRASDGKDNNPWGANGISQGVSETQFENCEDNIPGNVNCLTGYISENTDLDGILTYESYEDCIQNSISDCIEITKVIGNGEPNQDTGDPDGDGFMGEDWYNGYDDDGDGLIDEDYFFADGIDNDGDCPGDTNGDGIVCSWGDENVDEGIDWQSDTWIDGYDNNQNGMIDEESERYDNDIDKFNMPEWAYNMEFKDIIITKIKNQEYINGKYNVWYDPLIDDNDANLGKADLRGKMVYSESLDSLFYDVYVYDFGDDGVPGDNAWIDNFGDGIIYPHEGNNLTSSGLNVPSEGCIEFGNDINGFCGDQSDFFTNIYDCGLDGICEYILQETGNGTYEEVLNVNWPGADLGDGNGQWDVFDFDYGLTTESDCNNIYNGVYYDDFGLCGDGIWDEGDDWVDVNNDGVFTFDSEDTIFDTHPYANEEYDEGEEILDYGQDGLENTNDPGENDGLLVIQDSNELDGIFDTGDNCFGCEGDNFHDLDNDGIYNPSIDDFIPQIHDTNDDGIYTPADYTPNWQTENYNHILSYYLFNKLNMCGESIDVGNDNASNNNIDDNRNSNDFSDWGIDGIGPYLVNEYGSLIIDNCAERPTCEQVVESTYPGATYDSDYDLYFIDNLVEDGSWTTWNVYYPYIQNPNYPGPDFGENNGEPDGAQNGFPGEPGVNSDGFVYQDGLDNDCDGCDFDFDGFPNFQEIHLGTNIYDPTDFPLVASLQSDHAYDELIDEYWCNLEYNIVEYIPYVPQNAITGVRLGSAILDISMNSLAFNNGNPDINNNGILWNDDLSDQDPDGSRSDVGALFYRYHYYGCTDPNATNYNIHSEIDNNTCIYEFTCNSHDIWEYDLYGNANYCNQVEVLDNIDNDNDHHANEHIINNYPYLGTAGDIVECPNNQNPCYVDWYDLFGWDGELETEDTNSNGILDCIGCEGEWGHILWETQPGNEWGILDTIGYNILFPQIIIDNGNYHINYQATYGTGVGVDEWDPATGFTFSSIDVEHEFIEYITPSQFQDLNNNGIYDEYYHDEETDSVYSEIVIDGLEYNAGGWILELSWENSLIYPQAFVEGTTYELNRDGWELNILSNFGSERVPYNEINHMINNIQGNDLVCYSVYVDHSSYHYNDIYDCVIAPRAINDDNTTDDIELEITEYNLKQNYPNPFNPVTTIEYSIPEYTYLQINVFDIRGRKVTELFKGHKNKGEHRLLWNASRYASGIYFVQIVSDNYKMTKRMTLIK